MPYTELDIFPISESIPITQNKVSLGYNQL